MKKENDISVEMFRVVGNAAPFVMVNYVDKHAKEHAGLMMLDSGSTENFLSHEMAECIVMPCVKENKREKILTITNEYMEVSRGEFSFSLGGNQYLEKFFFNSNSIAKIVGELSVIGILGNRFMQQHSLVIDYSDFTIHTSNVNPDNLAITDCDFFFPMEIGLKYYGLPVLSIRQNKKDIVMLADTGATHNVIALKTIKDNGFEHLHFKSKETISGISGGMIELEEGNVKFRLLTLTEDGTYEKLYHDKFYLSPHYIISYDEGECKGKDDQLPPVEALIGSPFMAKQGWVLDFGAKVIFKRNC
jgi:hypothetical protein